MNILVIRLSALGDVTMTLPAIYSAARAYPQHTFFVATSAFASRLFISPPANVQMLALSQRETRGAAAVWHLIRKLRPLHIDAVADLHNVLRSWLVDTYFRCCGKPVAMLDKRRGERPAILHQHARTAVPFTQRYFDVFARLGLPAPQQFTTVFPDGLPPLPPGLAFKGEERWVGIAPFARYQSKTYDLGQMQEVVRLTAEAGCRVFLFGARGQEAEILQSWAQEEPRATVVAGQLPLEQELALMAHLDVMLTMDSANMHLASLTGIRVVSFWGGTTTACGFLGFGQQETDALQGHLSCQPCSIAGTDSCPLRHMKCTKAIAPSAIAHKLLHDKD